MQYLVDTDWAIDYIRGVHDVKAGLDQLIPQGVGMSIISIAELYEGMFGAPIRQEAEREIREFTERIEAVVDLDEQVCREFGRQRSRLRAEGNIIGDMDILIGSTAMVHGVTLLTNNRRHFERLHGLTIISI